MFRVHITSETTFTAFTYVKNKSVRNSKLTPQKDDRVRKAQVKGQKLITKPCWYLKNLFLEQKMSINKKNTKKMMIMVFMILVHQPFSI